MQCMKLLARKIGHPSSIPPLRLLAIANQFEIDVERLEHHVHCERLVCISIDAFHPVSLRYSHHHPRL